MMKRMLHIILLLGIGTTLNAQLNPLLDQYHFNGLAINPAYAGSQDALNIGIYSRIQWLGFEGAPRTNSISVHSPLRNRKVNLGMIVVSDKLGSKAESGFLLNYAYRMDLGKGKWSLGLAAGLTSISTDMQALRFIDTGDRLLQNPAERAVMPEFSFGTYYYTGRLTLGFSMPLFMSQFTSEEKGGYQLSFNLGTTNYMLTAGYLFRITESVEILPSLLLKTNPANNTQLDVHCDVILKEKIWLGASVRTNGTLSALLQLQASPQLRLGYSFGYELSELSSFQHGSHEIMLSYCFKYLLEVVSPRNF